MASGRPPASTATPPRVALRKEIRKMSAAEQARFCDAVQTMMRNRNGPRSSEFYRLASYHGWPGRYCSHGIQLFPAWHRAYLVEFETALQAADVANGNDGNIGLPYWDWTDTSHPEMVPAILRTRFAQFNRDLFPESNTLSQRGYSLNSDSYIRQMIEANRLRQQTYDAILDPQFWQFASTEFTQGVSVEDPHNSMHVFCGYPMSVVDFAAFHPIFFLHHCQIDRLFEAHLAVNKEAKEEFESHEWRLFTNRILAQRRGLRRPTVPSKPDPNRPKTNFELPMRPFKNRFKGGRDFLPSDCFDASALGYKYDALPSVPPQALKEPPTWAVFSNVDVVTQLAHQSYTLFVYIVPREAAASWQLPATADDVLATAGYAGVTAIFGGKGEECENCVNRRPITLLVDITQALRDAGLTPYEVVLRVAALDENMEMHSLESTPIPQPTIEGPYFRDLPLMLHRQPGGEGEEEGGVAEAVRKGETEQLQRYLEKYGYYQGVDGDFGPITEAAVKRLQRMLKITVDGIAGPETKAAMMRPRHDDKEDEGVEDVRVYEVGQTVQWWLGPPPAYLDRRAVLLEVDAAFTAWAGAVPLFFLQTQDASQADLVITWDDHTPDNEFRFTGPGGSLAFTKDRAITLDVSEMWLLQGQQPRPHPSGKHVYPSFHLLPVLVHELGHAIGLKHSDQEGDAMLPYYDATRVTISDNDWMRAALLYPLEQEFSQVYRSISGGQQGGMTREQLYRAMTNPSGGSPLSNDEFGQLWASVDPWGTGSISQEQFLELISSFYAL